MATQFDFSNLGSIFGGGVGATPSGLDALLSEDQRKLMNRNAALSAAAALLQAGGRSAVPIGLGQAFGSALEAGQKSYQQGRAGSLQDLLLGQKLKEAERTAMADAGFLKFLQSPQGMEAAAAPSAQPAPLTGVAVPPIERFMSETMPVAAAAAPNMLGNLNLSPQQRALVASLGREKGTQYLLDMMKPEASPDSIKTLRALGLPVTMANLRQLDKPEASPEAIRTLNALGLPPTLANLRLLDKPEASPEVIRTLQAAGVPITFENIMKYKQSGANRLTVDMTRGQEGFSNEMKLSGAFKQEPIYKDFSDMKSAYGQVVSSLAQGTPIGDVAGATKVMKLLDPGSVVRESELGIAMAAAGRMDRLQNYFSNMMSGQKLTPTQRDDFQKLSNELYSAAGQAYNNKRAEYKQFGDAYNFKNLDTALGAPATIPSVMKNQPSSATKTMQWDGTKFVFK